MAMADFQPRPARRFQLGSDFFDGWQHVVLRGRKCPRRSGTVRGFRRHEMIELFDELPEPSVTPLA